MNARFKLILKDKSVKYSLIFSTFFLFFQTIIILLFVKTLPPFIPFFNSLPWGEERLAQSQIVIAVPVFILILIIINFYISSKIYQKHTMIARVLLVNGFLIAFLGFLALIQILLLVL